MLGLLTTSWELVGRMLSSCYRLSSCPEPSNNIPAPGHGCHHRRHHRRHPHHNHIVDLDRWREGLTGRGFGKPGSVRHHWRLLLPLLLNIRIGLIGIVRLKSFVPNCTRANQCQIVVQSFTGQHLAVLGFTKLYWDLLCCTGQYWIVMGCTWLCWTVLGCTGL